MHCEVMEELQQGNGRVKFVFSELISVKGMSSRGEEQNPRDCWEARDYVDLDQGGAMKDRTG